MFWFIVIIVITLFLWIFYNRTYNYWNNRKVPQTKPWLFFGDIWPTLLRKMDLFQWMDYIYYTHPKSKLIGFYQFASPFLMVRDPQLIKQVTVKDFDHFTDHNALSLTEEMDPLWSRNLFSLRGQKWRDMRALLSGSFTSSKMRIMYTFISEESKKFVHYFMKKDKDVIDVNLKDIFSRYTNDVIASTSFGIKVNSLENQDNEFYLLGKEVTNSNGIIVVIRFVAIMLVPWLCKKLKIGFISKRTRNFFTRIIDETIKTREEQGIVRPDLINLLLEVKNGRKKTEEEKEVPDSGFAVVQESSEIVKDTKKPIEITNMDIASQAMIFFFAGFDSVSSAMCFTCHELAINPGIQDKLRGEIKDIFENTHGNPSYESTLGMKYLDMVVSESLRKWPLAPAADRVCVKPYTLKFTNPEESTLNIEVSTTLWIPIYNIHHDPKYYEDPDKFIPERFSEENKHKIQPYTYLPFGVGPRACIGSRFALLEIKSILFHLLNQFEVVPNEKTHIPLKLDKTSFTIAVEGGFQYGLKRI